MITDYTELLHMSVIYCVHDNAELARTDRSMFICASHDTMFAMSARKMGIRRRTGEELGKEEDLFYIYL